MRYPNSAPGMRPDLILCGVNQVDVDYGSAPRFAHEPEVRFARFEGPALTIQVNGHRLESREALAVLAILFAHPLDHTENQHFLWRLGYTLDRAERRP